MDQTIEKRIFELPKHVADKIAAGEVVDRPLSIVKELVENSIDAGATSITIEIRNGGKTYIRVTDNGSGIQKEDAELAFKRHATSKIKTDTDLDHIESLGFRGEALASISAVSKVELITKTAGDKSGIRLRLEGGEMIEKEDTGCPEGTTFIIEELFFNTPARLKFMKQDATESTLIIDFISKMTLAYPQIKFRLVNNGNILFSTNGKGDIYSNILTIYSREIGDKLIHLSEDHGQMALEAFISAPSNSRTNRKSQIFFVNGRYISSKLMENAVTDAYQEKLFEGRYPVSFLFLRVSPESLDVNIHPNKREVRFDDEKAVREFIAASIRKSLKTKDAIPEIKENNLFKFKPSALAADPSKTLADPVSTLDTDSPKPSAEGVDASVQTKEADVIKTQAVKSNGTQVEQRPKEEQVDIKRLLFESRLAKEKQKQYSEQNRSSVSTAASAVEFQDGDEKTPAPLVNEALDAYVPSEKRLNSVILENNQAGNTKPADDFEIGALTVTGSIFGTYITAVDDSCFYLIDQHGAHERIFYEQLLAEYRKEEKTQQMILTPFVINVTHAVKNDTGRMLHFLGNLGFEIEEFGPTAYIVKAIPYYMGLEESKDFIDYLLDNISEEGELDNQKKIASIITSACKKAVKAHDVLDRQEIDRLMADLAKTKNPYSCPHGRPTFVKLRKYEIEKMFKRV
ncbi:DNA mismatch repair endonuclease MutL [Anoxybacterium hadale]|uniref:DNA mismatch repair endonuclease MutL n=1 Tax=Anoxybacterium hadale TaxID=3408580 RepID=UPI003B000520